MSGCPVCREQSVRAMGPYRHAHSVFDACSRSACDTCGMVFAWPMPGTDALSEYNSNYFARAHGGAPRDPVSLAFHSGINRLRVAHVERYAAARGIEPAQVLEVGAGGGHFARHWLERHQGCRYWAIESDVTMHSGLWALGVELCVQPEDMAPGVTLDMVVMSHVLEHTTDPAEFLAMMTSRLRRGGALFIEVPCRDWEYKDADEPHLLFFDKGPMHRLLASCGFGDARVSYHGRELSELRAETRAARFRARARASLLARGIVAPFARTAPGLEVIDVPLERAAVAPFQAHIEQERPSGWLRAMALKL